MGIHILFYLNPSILTGLRIQSNECCLGTGIQTSAILLLCWYGAGFVMPPVPCIDTELVWHNMLCTI